MPVSYPHLDHMGIAVVVGGLDLVQGQYPTHTDQGQDRADIPLGEDRQSEQGMD